MGKEYQTNAQYSMFLFVLIFMRMQIMIITSQGIPATGVRTQTTRQKRRKKLQPRLECVEYPIKHAIRCIVLKLQPPSFFLVFFC